MQKDGTGENESMDQRTSRRSGYIGVIVALVAGAIWATSSVTGSVMVIMLASLGMLSVCNIAQADDPTFLHRNRWLMFLILGGLTIPPPIYLGKRLLEAEDSGMSFELRLVLSIVLFVISVGSAVFGTWKSISQDSKSTQPSTGS
jgi:hypothetical protein